MNCSYMGSSGQCRASFDSDYCSNCPHRDQCHAKVFKKVSVVILSVKASERAAQQKKMKTDEAKEMARIRNGVETLPSILRREYHVDEMPVRGKIPGKFFFGCKIAALNFRKLFNYRRGTGNYAQNPALA